jgi:hypothetical protein
LFSACSIVCVTNDTVPPKRTHSRHLGPSLTSHSASSSAAANSSPELNCVW